jgi:hypothetical protein
MPQDWKALKGYVEVDETYHGGKKRTKGRTSKWDSDDDQPKGHAGTRNSLTG